jgi:hypothetical protein
MTRTIVALLVGASMAAFALPALAQGTAVQVTPERRAAIHRCIAEARSMYPGPDQDANRTERYVACMGTAGLAP